MASVFRADSSGMKSMRRSRSSSCTPQANPQQEAFVALWQPHILATLVVSPSCSTAATPACSPCLPTQLLPHAPCRQSPPICTS